MARKPKPPIEYASLIGSNAFDLYAHGDAAAEGALAVLWTVNPELFAWLTARLLAVQTSARP